MQSEDRLDLKRVLGRTIGRGVGEADRDSGQRIRSAVPECRRKSPPAPDPPATRPGRRFWTWRSERRKSARHRPGIRFSFCLAMAALRCQKAGGRRTLCGFRLSARNCYQRKGWPDQLHERKQGVGWYTGDQWPYDQLVGLLVSHAWRSRRAWSVIRRRVAVPDDQLGQSGKGIGEVPFQLFLLGQRRGRCGLRTGEAADEHQRRQDCCHPQRPQTRAKRGISLQ